VKENKVPDLHILQQAQIRSTLYPEYIHHGLGAARL
jgi:hypothetical protein